MKSIEPVSVTLTVDTRIDREGKHWIVSCPALGLVAQNFTLAKAKKSFAEVVLAAVGHWKEEGILPRVFEQALKDSSRDSRRSSSTSNAMQTIPIPIDFLATKCGR